MMRNDASATRRLKQRARAVGTIQRAVETGVDLLLPVFGRAVAEALAEDEARVVDQDVETAEIALDVRDHLLDDVRIRNVGLIGLRLAAGFLDFGGHSFGLGL
ncbi:putative TIM-barrel enzyme [Bradyrhizobium sp. LM2.7]